MYDNNGLELTPATSSMNAYRLTAVDLTAKKFTAYAAPARKNAKEFGMIKIGYYSDPRDAAFVAQEFSKVYDKAKIRQMKIDATFCEIAREFRENLEVPEWKYDHEGFTIEELLNGGYEVYQQNYCDCARTAIVEAIRVGNLPTPPISKAKELIAKVEELKKTGMTYRAAAAQIITRLN